MNKRRMRGALYASLIGIGLVLAATAEKAVAFPPWNQQINTSSRFTVLSAFDRDAVLDRETGLVWERSPDTTTRDWFGAQWSCNIKTVGGRLGWRLPTLQELASLIDPTRNPALPLNHPFQNVQSSFYWSATSNTDPTADGSLAWGVFFVGYEVNTSDKANAAFYVWCVRGGQGVDPQ